LLARNRRELDALFATAAKLRQEDSMADTQLVIDIHRHFAAPRERVYRAFTDEDQIAVWFAPTGVLVLRDTVSVDATVGGHRRLTMVTYDGMTSWSINTTFTEVIENQRLVGYENTTGPPNFDAHGPTAFSMEFIDEEGGTRIELRAGPLSTEMEVISREFWLQSFTKLDALLAGQTNEQ
jgi:uncharacterized protein YndB with AHSA1/START domain